MNLLELIWLAVEASTVLVVAGYSVLFLISWVLGFAVLVALRIAVLSCIPCLMYSMYSV